MLPDQSFNLATPLVDNLEQTTNAYQIYNGDFETGNMNGWKIVEGEQPGEITNVKNYFGGSLNMSGEYCFSAVEGDQPGTPPSYESRMGVIRSNIFTLRAEGWITFKLGGALPEKTGIRVIDAITGEVLQSFNNKQPYKEGEITKEGTMVQYKYHFNNVEEKLCYVEIFDQENDAAWRLVIVDDIMVDYKNTPEIEAVDYNALLAN